MLKITKAGRAEEREKLERELASIDFSQEAAVFIRFSRGDDDNTVADIQHNLNGALRSFRYLAEKVKQGYDSSDVRGQKLMASIDRHVESLEQLKNSVDDIFSI